MVFDPRVDLLLPSGRHDVDVVLHRDQIAIARGRQSEGSQSAPTRCTMSIDNTDGTYSPRNPTGPLYGSIGRNTPAQVYLGTPHLGAGGGTGTASTSHVAPSVTASSAGLLVCGWMSDDPVTYTVPGSMTPLGQTTGTYSTMRTAYEVVSAGATGTRTATASASEGYSSVSAVVHGAGAAVEEVSEDASNIIDDVMITTADTTEAGWWLVAVQGWLRGFDAPMPDAPYGDDGGWILLGDSGRITGDFDGVFTVYLRQRVWVRRVTYDGAQTVIFPGVANASAPVADNHAALLVVSGVDDWDIRATVEIPSWPSRWDLSGNHVWVPIEGAGILRRLSQGSSPLRSPVRRAITGAGATLHIGRDLLPVAYWPLEDVDGSTQAASGLPGGAPLVASAAVSWGSVEVTGSAPGPDWSTSTGYLGGPAAGVSAGDDWGVGCLVQYTGSTTWTALRVQTQGSPYLELRLILGTTVTVDAVDSAASTILSAATDLSDGDPYWVEIRAAASGSDVAHSLYINGNLADSAITTGAPGVPSAAYVLPRTADTATLMHLGIWAEPTTTTYTALIAPALTAHVGETAGRRIERLCHEEGIPIHIVGDADETVPMGGQPSASLLTLLRECEETDLGILYEPREVLGLAYRTRASRYNRPVTLALDYAASEVAPPLTPDDDDRYTRNDVTVSRSGGSSYQYEVDEGPLSTQDPPNGVGRYDTSVTVNVQSDALLPDQASARAHLGAWDEARYPTVSVNLRRLEDDGKAALARAAAALDAGDRVTIASPPVWLPPDAIDQHVEGYTETLGVYVRDLALVCVPAGPYTVGVVEDEVLGRADTDGSEVAADFDAGTDTSMSVDITDGPLWITTAAQPAMFPFDIQCGGVVLEVTGISGGSSPQTFTITQTPVNGVVKTITADTPLSLAHPWRAAL